MKEQEPVKENGTEEKIKIEHRQKTGGQSDRCASGINSSRLRLWSLLFFRTFPAGNSGKRILTVPI